MSIKGDLRSMDLTQVLQMLSLNQKDGRLVIDLGRHRVRSILFCRRGLTLLPLVDLEDEEILVHVLRRRNIAGGCLLEARKKYERPGKPLVQALMEVGLLERSWLLPLLRECIQSRLLDLFFHGGARFEFHEEAVDAYLTGLDASENGAFFFGVEELVMEGSRRLDEWDSIRNYVATTDEIYHVVPGQDGGLPATLSTEALEVGNALDGIRCVDDVADFTGLGIYTTSRHLADFLQEGLIAPVEPETLEEAAHGLFSIGRLDDSLRLFERVLKLMQGDADVHLKIASIYERKKEFRKAAEHYRSLAEHFLGEGAIAQSYEYYQTVLHLIPTDLDVLGRIVGLYLRYKDQCRLETFDVVDGSRMLVQIYREMGERDRAIDLLQRLVKVGLDLPHSRNVLIQLYIDTDRGIEAVDELEKVGEEMLAQDDEKGATRVYRQILKLNPASREASQVLDRVDGERKKGLQARRRRFGMLRSSVYISVFIVGYLYYNDMASLELRTIDVQPMVQKKRFDAARRRLDEFVDRFPFSTAAMDARIRLKTVDEQFARHRGSLALNKAKRENEVRARLQTAKGAFASAQQALARNDFHGARALLERASEYSRGHDEWRAASNLDRNIREVDGYLDGARKMRAAAETLAAKGRHEQAHEALVRLFRRFPHAPSAKGVTVPVRLESRPAGAAVMVNGRFLDSCTPVVARLPLGSESELGFHLDGHDRVQINVHGEEKFRHVAHLPIRPVLAVQSRAKLGPTPNVDGDLAVAGGRDGHIVAIDLARKSVAWTARFGGLSDRFVRPVVAADGVYSGAVEAGLFRFRRSDGHKLWSVPTDGIVVHEPVVVDRTVVAGDTGGTVWCVWAANGDVRWKNRLGRSVSAGPSAAGNLVYVGNEAGVLVALDAKTGTVRARCEVQGSVCVPAVMAASTVAVVTTEGMVYGLDPQTLAIRWSVLVEGKVEAPLVVAAGKLYVTVVDGRLHRFDLAQGTEDRTPYRAGAKLMAGPAVIGNFVYLAGLDGVLRVLDVGDFTERWRQNLGSAVRGAPVVWRHLVLLTTLNGKLYGFPVNTGE